MKGGQKDLRGVKFSIVLAALLGLAISPVRAQDRFEDDYLRSTLSMENGLPCNFIDDVCQDDAGFLWLATSGGGLCRFDGYDLLAFSATSGTPLKSNFIRNVCEDRFHRLWIASEGGLDLLDLGTLDRLELPHPDLAAYSDLLCSFLTLDGTGNLWFKTGKTLVRVSFDEKGQDTAANLTLSADGKMSGALSGTWSFDEAKQFLSLTAGGKSIVVVVAHEVDWEASPRKETIVYAGTEKRLNATWWGKKVQ